MSTEETGRSSIRIASNSKGEAVIDVKCYAEGRYNPGSPALTPPITEEPIDDLTDRVVRAYSEVVFKLDYHGGRIAGGQELQDRMVRLYKVLYLGPAETGEEWRSALGIDPEASPTAVEPPLCDAVDPSDFGRRCALPDGHEGQHVCGPSETPRPVFPPAATDEPR